GLRPDRRMVPSRPRARCRTRPRHRLARLVPVTYLDFEQPLAALDARVAALRAGARGPAVTRELRQLAVARRRLEREVYESLTAWERVQLARHVDRPQTLDYVARLCRDFFELHGDRAFGDDPAIVAGFGSFHGHALAVV